MTDSSAGFIAEATALYSKAPIVASVIMILVCSTPIIIARYKYLNKKQAIQVEDNKHIRDHEYRMKKGGLK